MPADRTAWPRGELEAFENEFPERDYWIEMNCPEFTCVCPRSRQPDFARLIIRYVPDRQCIELKSLKLFLHAFRDVGIFHENVVNHVLDTFVSACRPRQAEVVGIFNARGGIQTTVTATFSREAPTEIVAPSEKS